MYLVPCTSSTSDNAEQKTHLFARKILKTNAVWIFRFKSLALNILRRKFPQDIENKDSQNRGVGTSVMDQEEQAEGGEHQSVPAFELGGVGADGDGGAEVGEGNASQSDQ